MTGTARPGRASLDRLSPAEEHVYRLVGLGLTNEEIAKSLFISKLTVRTHVKRVHAKLNITGRPRLAIESYKAHWQYPNRFAGAIELLKLRGGAGLNAEAIALLTEVGHANPQA